MKGDINRPGKKKTAIKLQKDKKRKKKRIREKREREKREKREKREIIKRENEREIMIKRK